MDEQSFLDRIKSAPGDTRVLREYAQWLTVNHDSRGPLLTAELDVEDAQATLFKLQQHRRSMRSICGDHPVWLDIVLPLTVKSPADGIFSHSSTPDEAPFIKVGDPCVPGTLLGMVKNANTFYRIHPGHFGVIAEIAVSNGAIVVKGEILMKLKRPQTPSAIPETRPQQSI